VRVSVVVRGGVAVVLAAAGGLAVEGIILLEQVGVLSSEEVISLGLKTVVVVGVVVGRGGVVEVGSLLLVCGGGCCGCCCLSNSSNSLICMSFKEKRG